MPGFDIGRLADPLDWDFRGIRADGSIIPGWPKQLAGAHGTITEPSDKQIATFLDGMKNLVSGAAAAGLTSAGITEDMPAADLVSALNELAVDDVLETVGNMAALYSALCSGKPTKTQIMLMPLRYRSAFFEWLQREVISPEAGPGAGGAVVRMPPRAAAG